MLNSILLGIYLNGNVFMTRIRPYPPSFSRMAAKIIEPAIGASTWALGSHKWVENIGSFTINPVTSINQKNCRIYIDWKLYYWATY